MTDTPRTDAINDTAAWRSPDRWVTQLQVFEDHARQLERELAAARKDAERYRVGYEAAIAFVDSHAADHDLTAEMCKTYAVLQEKRAAIDASRVSAPPNPPPT